MDSVEEEEISFTSVRINRDEWIFRAENLLSLAKSGGTNVGKKSKNRKKLGLSHYIINAPTLHLEHESHLYIQAAEAFRICSKWMDTAEAYEQAALVQKLIANRSSDEQHLLNAAFLFCEAGLYFERVQNGYGEDCYNKAISLFCDIDRYDLAARFRFKVAETNEEEKNYSLAIDNYQKAAICFETAHLNLPFCSCLEKAAYLMGMSGNYNEASCLFATIGRRYLQDNLTKYSAKHYFFRSVLLLLAGNMDESYCKKCIEEYQKEDCRFEESPQCDLLLNLINIEKNCDLHSFADHLYDFTAVCELDEWCIGLLKILHLRIEEKNSDTS